MANVGTTSVPAISWGANGPQAPSAPAILAGVQQDYNVAFNVTFNWNGSTPQGQLASSTAAAINDSNQYVLYYATQIDPAYSTGRMQDAIARLSFLERLPAEPTVLQINCNGTSAAIPAGPASYGVVIDPSGNLYQCTGAGTLPAGGGTITLAFACTVPGPIPIPASVKIYQSIPGWDSATLVSGVVGQNTETSQQFEQRRQQSVAANAVNSNTAILGAVLGVPGVLDAYVIDNPTPDGLDIGGVLIIPNSVYVAVTGGSAAAVAQAIWSKKPPGIAMNGGTFVTVEDKNPAYSPPYPSYNILFQIPSPLPVYFNIVIQNSASVPADAVTQVQNAIINAFNGANSGASFTASISGTVMTVTAVASGTVAVGQSVSGAGIVPGTKIASLISGVGNAGTYTVSLPQNVTSTAMTSNPATNLPVPPRARIASTIYASQYTVPVAALGSWASVKSATVGSANTGNIVVGWIAGTTLTVTAVTSGGPIAVGDWITGFDAASNIMVGTTITAFVSGSGGVGTYTVSASQTVAGAAFTGNASGANLTASAVTGTIAVGDIITGTGVPTNTAILSQTSGTPGGAGVYVTSLATTASSASLRANVRIVDVAANQNIVPVGIAQEPTIAASNISVVFS
jgi:hypothetical protein